jgi:hypothetical protein
MPGPYAHITLLHELMRPTRLKSIFSPSSGFEAALTTYFPYCSLGAVSPDYPNLAWVTATAPQWADAMHYTRACQMIRSGIGRVRHSTGAVRDKQIAWLLGYCAHVATDVTIHPVVQARVGEYAENQRQHRVCEMNQDSYIYRRMKLGEIGESDYFAVTVAQCYDSHDPSQLDSDISSLWEGMLEDVHPEQFIANSPDCNHWHQRFIERVTAGTKSTVRLFPLAGTIAARMELAYPAHDKVDMQFIEELLIPTDQPLFLHYDEIFDHAAGNVTLLWRQVEQALCHDDPRVLSDIGEWNLDNGCDENGRLVFWESSANL